MLNKFPITKNGIEYLVTIKQVFFINCPTNRWDVNVYKKVKRKIFKGYSDIHCYNSYYKVKEKDAPNFIEFAKCAINEYIIKEEEKNKYKCDLNKSITDFKNWDGKI